MGTYGLYLGEAEKSSQCGDVQGLVLEVGTEHRPVWFFVYILAVEGVLTFSTYTGWRFVDRKLREQLE